MDVTLDRTIKAGGAMWEAVCDRTETPVLVITDQCQTLEVYELSLPSAEKHPFWRVSKRYMTSREMESFREDAPHLMGIGTLEYLDKQLNDVGAPYMRVRGYIYNGRVLGRWNVSMERVLVDIRLEGD